MKRFRVLCIVLTFSLAAVSLAAPEENLSGRVLTKQLINKETCSKAFYALWCRANPAKAKTWTYEGWVDSHYDPVVVTCPQGDGADPIYVVLYGYLSRTKYLDRSGYEVDNVNELFAPTNGEFSASWDKPAIDAFTADGRHVAPFGGNNVLSENGVIADVNADGWFERVDFIPYTEGDVLQVEVVKEEAQRILAVVFNRGGRDWSFRVTDADGDGIFDIELGPGTKDGIKTKVTYKWDKESSSYIGPEGRKGDHFRRLNTKNIKEDFAAMEKFEFPRDPDVVNEHDWKAKEWSRKGMKKPEEKDYSKPYVYRSLKDLSAEEIAKYMGRGKAMSDLAYDAMIKTHVPDDFWDADPKQAALQMVDANRYPTYKARFRIAVDDRDGVRPPETGSVAYSYASSRCYNAIDEHYFLRVDPKKSYLIYARSWSDGVVFYNFVYDAPGFDFRYCELPYEDARQVMAVIWWMHRVRSMDTASSSGVSCMGSTADGSGTMVIRDSSGRVDLDVSETVYAAYVSERWNSDYDKEVFLNLAEYVLTSALPKRLGERWSSFALDYSHDVIARGEAAPRYTDEEKQRIIKFTGEFLDLYSNDQTGISDAVVRESLRAAVSFCRTELIDRIRRIQDGLPPEPDKPGKTYEEIKAEIAALDAQAAEPGDYTKTQDKRQALMAEMMAALESSTRVTIGDLRSDIAASLERLEMANDPEKLSKLAASKERGCQWALQRLKQIDKKRYAAALEWWLNATADKRRRQIFEEIARVDARRATELAKAFPPDEAGDLTVSSFAHLGMVDGIPDEGKRVDSLIKIMLNPKSAWEQRAEAIEQLVPSDDPMKYASRKIDEALLKVFDPKLGDELSNYTLGNACSALARRGREEYFDVIAKRMKTEGGVFVYEEMLEALGVIAAKNPNKLRPRLARIIEPDLKKTSRMLEDIFWVIWTADLRSLKGDLERLATSSPGDYQSEKANSGGGSPSDVTGRFHMARKIVAMWNEEDPLTRAKLLLSFGFQNAPDFVGKRPSSRTLRMEMELKALSAELTPKQKEDAMSFAEWCVTGIDDPYSDYHGARKEFNDRIRTIFGSR